MPDRVKEKLVELLQHDDCPLFMVFGDKVDVLADYLIANGVTVQEWISVKDRLPEAQKRVLTVDDSGYVEVNCISIRFGGWFSDAFGKKRIPHWMPLPQPPKGEKENDGTHLL